MKLETTLKYNQELMKEYNQDGLSYLCWELFDSPDAVGSGYRFMERKPVLILDDIIRENNRYRPHILLGYTSKPVSDLLVLPSISPYRVGKGIMLRVTSAPKRMFIVKHLILRGVERIAISDNTVEFDTDDYLYEPNLYLR